MAEDKPWYNKNIWEAAGEFFDNIHKPIFQQETPTQADFKRYEENYAKRDLGYGYENPNTDETGGKVYTGRLEEEKQKEVVETPKTEQKNVDLGDNKKEEKAAETPGDTNKETVADALLQDKEEYEANEEVKQAAASLAWKYQAGNSRLVNFAYSDPSLDDAHRAYLKLYDVSSDGLGLTRLRNSLVSSETSILLPIVQSLETGYTSVIITSFNESFEEKQAVMPTIGDTFALTFSGKNPTIISIGGSLPFDYSKDTDNWYLAYINAYKFIFRASILAKYHCQLHLIFPDFSNYIIYPISFQSSMTSDQDNVIPFTMNAYITNLPLSRASEFYTIPLVTNNPADVGSGWLDSVFGNTVSTVANNFNNNKGVKALTDIVKQGVGAYDLTNMAPYGQRETKS